jgi:hypothetical protein
MTRVSWSESAVDDLMNVVKVPALMDELRDNAEVTLHDITTASSDEGVEGGTMWHRGFTHEQERQIKEGILPESPDPQVWDFFLIYCRRRWLTPGFEVRRVCSTGEVAGWWMQEHDTGGE